MTSRLISKVCSLITTHSNFCLALSLLIGLTFSIFLPRVRTVDNVDYFTLDSNKEVQFYDGFKEIFGNDEFFVIAFEKENIFTADNLKLLKDITTALETIDDIDEVTSLANVDDTVGQPDYFEVKKFLESIPESTEDLSALRKQAVENRLYRKNLISEDARTASIIVSTFDRPDDEGYRRRLLERTHQVLEPFDHKANGFHIAGWTVTNLRLSEYMVRDIFLFIPLSYVLIGFVVLLIFRNLRITLLSVLNISICLGTTMGLFGMLDIRLNNVTVVVSPLVMALALCDTVHIFSHLRKPVLVEYPDKRQALASVLSSVLIPCFLTSLTTAIGFLSLAVSDIPPIQEFAWLASAGMIFEFFFSFLFLPPLILFCRPEKIYQAPSNDRALGLDSILERLFRQIKAHCVPISVISMLVMLGGFLATPLIIVETDLLAYFKKSSPVRVELDYVEARLGGTASLDISLTALNGKDFKDPALLSSIEQIQSYLEQLPEVDVTTSFVDFLKDMNESFHDEDPAFYRIPESRNMVAQYMLLYDSDDTEDFVNDEYDRARIAARISAHSSLEQEKLINKIQSHLDIRHFPNVEVRVTGQAVERVVVIDALVRGQIYSLSIALLVIAGLMFIMLRSARMGALSLLPNLFPITFNFGLMGILGISLNTGTALIATVALGIAVDDTIHFLTQYQRHRSDGVSIGHAVERTIMEKGRAFIASSVILCIGFGVLVLASFVPTIYFGFLSAVIMIAALIGDLVVLPALLLLKDRSNNS